LIFYKFLVLRERIELSTSPLPMVCSTTELPQHRVGFCHNGRLSASDGLLLQDESLAVSIWVRNVISRIITFFEDIGSKSMKMPKTDIPDTQNDRKKRLAEALRQNLQLRKARVRADETQKNDAKTESTSDKT
jgi:hypothetical protein